MNWLITGGCGFIGRALTGDLLAEGGHKLRVLDNLSVGTRADLAAVAHFAELGTGDDPADWSAPLALLDGDIRDPEAVAQALNGADIVIHLAANASVPLSVESPMSDFSTNAEGTLKLLEGCRGAKIRRFVFASSVAPLGFQKPPHHEELATRPASPYGASKATGENYCSCYYHCFGIETVILRFGNVYGEGSHRAETVIAKFIKRALAGKRLEIYGDGQQTRDFLHISDLVRAVRLAAEIPGIGGETFQIATFRETTIAEITKTLLSAMRAEGMVPPEVFHGATRAGDVVRNFSDASKARERLGWTSTVSLETGLRATLRDFLIRQQP